MNSPIPKSETAFYVFDIDRLLQRAAYLKKKLSERVELCYAVKANTFIIGEFIGKIGRFEVCSPGEAEICTALGVDDKDMVISGVYKTPSVIETMVAEHDGGIYTVESLTQFEMLRSLSEKYDRVLPVLLRLTNDSQFGMDSGEIKSIIAERSKYKNKICSRC